MTTTTTPPTAPACPDWCELESGHGYLYATKEHYWWRHHRGDLHTPNWFVGLMGSETVKAGTPKVEPTFVVFPKGDPSTADWLAQLLAAAGRLDASSRQALLVLAQAAVGDATTGEGELSPP